MNPQDLKAVVVGAGWAGEGHTKALQHCGVEVVAICARRQEIVDKVASNLGIVIQPKKPSTFIIWLTKQMLNTLMQLLTVIIPV